MTLDLLLIPNHSSFIPVINRVNEHYEMVNRRVVRNDDLLESHGETLGPDMVALYKVNCSDVTSKNMKKPGGRTEHPHRLLTRVMPAQYSETFTWTAGAIVDYYVVLPFNILAAAALTAGSQMGPERIFSITTESYKNVTIVGFRTNGKAPAEIRKYFAPVKNSKWSNVAEKDISNLLSAAIAGIKDECITNNSNGKQIEKTLRETAFKILHESSFTMPSKLRRKPDTVDDSDDSDDGDNNNGRGGGISDYNRHDNNNGRGGGISDYNRHDNNNGRGGGTSDYNRHDNNNGRGGGTSDYNRHDNNSASQQSWSTHSPPINSPIATSINSAITTPINSPINTPINSPRTTAIINPVHTPNEFVCIISGEIMKSPIISTTTATNRYDRCSWDTIVAEAVANNLIPKSPCTKSLINPQEVVIRDQALLERILLFQNLKNIAENEDEAENEE